MYSKKVIIIVSLLLSFIVFCSVDLMIAKIKENNVNPIINTEATQEESKDKANNQIDNESNKQTIISTEDNIDIKEKQVVEKWQLQIPSISLIAPICEGTTKEVLNQYIGHFEITPKIDGNIGFAAHNRGYPVNYFQDLKNVKSGDKIIYTYGDITRTYKVICNIQISDIDWSYLQNTEDNTITLITCIENKPEYRRCVQAIESKEK